MKRLMKYSSGIAVLSAMLVVVSAVMSCSRGEAESPYARLDSLIECHDALVEAKCNRLALMRQPLSHDLSPDEEYEINRQLYEAYAEFQNDSAVRYARRNVDIAEQGGDRHRIIDSHLELMHLLTKSYLLDETMQMAQQLDTTAMDDTQRLYYYKILSDIYLFKVEFHKGSAYEAEYQHLLTDSRRQIARLAPPDSQISLLYKANYLNDVGRTTEAIALLEQRLADYHSGERPFSIITALLAFYHATIGDHEQQKRYLALSAASDIEGCIMENSSLRQLADLLFDEGDIDRAYRYINLSVEDATFYGTRLRNLQASQLVPHIIKAYQTRQERNYRQLRAMIVALGVVAVFLVVGLVIIAVLLKRYRRISASRQQINEQLALSNSQLRERDKIKEEYLGRFLALSSQLIDRNETHRKQLNRLAVERKTEQLTAQLKSPHFDYENAQTFYSNFDSAFLNIYPDFIDGVNALLTEGNHIQLKAEGQLTRELRILALIRLGIADNAEIAAILRSSISTIYTYRSRLKARALDKDTFEDDVARLQSGL